MTISSYPVFGDGEIEDMCNAGAKKLQLRIWKRMSRMDRMFLANRVSFECPVDTEWPTMYIDYNGYIRDRQSGRFL